MAQLQTAHQVSGTISTFAKNLGVNSGAAETILLDHVPCFAGRNLAVTVVCYTGAVTAVALYGSPDGINYMAVSGFNTFTVAANAMGHAECTGIWQFLRVTVTGTALVDVYLYAV